MATIGTLSARILADASGIRSGMGMTRNELRVTRQAFLATRDDSQKLQTALDQIESANMKGAFRDAADYQKAIDAVRSELDPAVVAQRELDNAIAATQDNLRQQINTFGMSADEIEQHALSQRGATAEQLQSVRALQQKRAALQADSDATARAKQITDQVRTPVERYQQEIRELNALLKSGKLSQQTHARAVQQAGQRYGVTGKKAADLTGQAKQLGLSHAGSIPGVSGLTSVLSAGHPVLIGVAAAVAAVTVAVKLAKAAIDAYTSGVRQAFEDIDKLAKTSAKLGIATDALQELRYAGEQTGVAANTMDMALQRMVRRVAEAAQGTGEAKNAIKELGLDAQALAAMSPDEQFRAIAGAMGDVTEQGERVRLGFKLFDSEGVALVNTLALGEQGLENMAARARELGHVVGQEDTQKVEEMRDAWNDVSKVLAGIAREAAADLAPALQVAAQELIAMLKPGSEFGDTLRFALEAVPPVVATIIDAANVMIGKFQQSQATAMEAANAVIQIAAAVDRARAKLTGGEVSQDLQVWADSYRTQIDALRSEANQRLAKGLAGGTAKEIEALGQQARKAMAEAGEGFVADTGAVDAAANSQANLLQQLDGVADSLAEQIVTAGMSADEVTRWKLAVAGASDESIRFVESMQQQAEAATAAAKSQANLMQQLDGVADSLAEQIVTAGMSEDEVTRWKLAVAGASDESIRFVKSMQQQAEAAADAAKLKKSIEDTVRALEEEIATAGESAETIARLKLQKQGAASADLDRIARLQQEAKAAKKAASLKETIKETTKALRERIETAGMSAAAAERWKLAQAGANAETLAEVHGLQKRAAAAELAAKKQKELWDSLKQPGGITATSAGSAEALARIDAYRQLQNAKFAKQNLPQPEGNLPDLPSIDGPKTTSAADPANRTASDPAYTKALDQLERIATATEAWLEKEGIVFEEVSM